MKTTIFLTTIVLFSLSACCSEDDSFPVFELTIQLFDDACNENLFDADGPLIREDVSFNWVIASGEEMEMESVHLDQSGNFTLDLVARHLNRGTDDDVNIFIDRATGERDTLKIFAETISRRCGDSYNINRIQFNEEFRNVTDEQVIALKLP